MHVCRGLHLTTQATQTRFQLDCRREVGGVCVYEVGGVSEGLLPEEAVGRSPAQTTSSQNLHPQNQAGAAAPSPAWQASYPEKQDWFLPTVCQHTSWLAWRLGNELAVKDTLICFFSPKAASGSLGREGEHT